MADNNSAVGQSKKISYPYIASKERAEHIQRNWKNVKTKMSASEVKYFLGEPDDEQPLYGPRTKNAKIIGKTYWYLIQRLQENGTVNEKKEKLIRVSFDLEDKVTRVESWGLEQ